MSMTPQDMITLRTRLGWTRKELARQLGLSISRIADYEAGQTRNKPPQPAPIPKVVELALRWLEEEARPLSPEEKAALWRNDALWISPHPGPAADSSREAMYRDSERGL